MVECSARLEMFREGQQIGAYTLIGKLGKGGFGEVWLAEKRSQFIVKRVAVKLPLDDQVNFDAIRQEAQLWEAASGHPNVLPIIDADVYDGQVCIVSEYADGGSLHDRLKNESKLSAKDSVEMTIGILNGLEFLHSRKIIHRDIKPQNILLQENTPRLADFGISRAMNTTAVSSQIIGTDAYMSPEAFDGKRNVQTDIWSVGVVLYQLLKGSLPFPQEHPTERMFAVLTKNFEPLGNEFPFDLCRIVEKALQKQPENRYATTSEMRDELLKAHVGIAHPTLAKTEVLRFPVEQSKFDNPPPTEDLNEIEKETAVKGIPKPIYEPPVTLPAMPSDSIATQFAQKPFAENNPQVITEAPTKTRKNNPVAKFVALSLGGVFFLIILLGIYALFQGEKKLEKFQDSNGKFGYKNSSGKVVVPPKYDEAIFFSDGMAAVSVNYKWGFIDGSGNEVIPLKYDNVSSFTGGYASVRLGRKRGYVDKQGVEVIPVKYDDFIKGFDGSSAEMILDGRKLRVEKYGKETDLGAYTGNINNPNISTYSTPAYNSNANTSH